MKEHRQIVTKSEAQKTATPVISAKYHGSKMKVMQILLKLRKTDDKSR